MNDHQEIKYSQNTVLNEVLNGNKYSIKCASKPILSFLENWVLYVNNTD